jgi:glucose-1-phosphatase
MAGISLILFDLNGVLYRYDRDARVARLAAMAGSTPEAVLAAIWQSGFEDEGDAGAFDADAYLAGFGARLEFPLGEGEWLEAQLAAVSPIAASLELLQHLRPGVSCAVLTNNNKLIQRHFARLYPQIGALVAGRSFVSAEFGARKPDPEVYRRCLAAMGASAGQTLFVDDSAANVAGAVEAGLHGLRYVDPPTLERDLAELGLLG